MLFSGNPVKPLPPNNLPQNLIPEKFRRVESKSEVQNLEMPHPNLEAKEKHPKQKKLHRPSPPPTWGIFVYGAW